MLIDSHCHLNSDALRDDAAGHVSRAAEAGVGRLAIVGSDLDDSREAVEMSHKFDCAWAVVGVHPHEVARYFSPVLTDNIIPAELERLAQDNRVVAVGEIGLDYYYDHSPRELQRVAFARQLEWAADINKPVVLHIRDAMDDAMEILKKFNDFNARHWQTRLLFHCYSGGFEYLDQVLALGGLCALGGAVTWKKSDELREVARRIPSDRILLETDCPYMAPVPFRGKINTPDLVKYVYETVASVRDITVDELASQVVDNAAKFFGW